MFNEKETSRAQGEPIHLYAFRVGAGSDSGFFYTDAENEITFDPGGGLGARVFLPIPIQRGRIEAKGTLDRARFDIVMPDDAAIARFFRQGIPSFVVTCVVFNGHANDPDNDFVAAWTGRIIGAKAAGGRTTLTGSPVASDMRRSGLRRNYQYGCTHVLYDPLTCCADITRASVSAVVASVTGGSVELQPGWNGDFDTSGFRNGARFEWTLPSGDRQIRTVRQVDADTNTVALNAAAEGLLVGDTVTIRLGCNRQLSDCEFLHLNVLNFGGQPYIPIEAPTGVKSQFY